MTRGPVETSMLKRGTQAIAIAAFFRGCVKLDQLHASASASDPRGGLAGAGARQGGHPPKRGRRPSLSPARGLFSVSGDLAPFHACRTTLPEAQIFPSRGRGVGGARHARAGEARRRGQWKGVGGL